MKLPVLSKKTVIIVSLSGVAFVTFLITLSVLMSGNTLKTKKNLLTPYEKSLRINSSEFLFPRYIGESPGKKYYFFREREKKWNDKEIARYWRPVREALGESLNEKIKGEINKMFSHIRD